MPIVKAMGFCYKHMFIELLQSVEYRCAADMANIGNPLAAYNGNLVAAAGK